MKNTQQLSDLIGSLTSANTDVEVTAIVNALKQAKASTASAVRTYGSVYSQNQMLQYDANGNISDVTLNFEGRAAISDSVLAQLKSDLGNQIANYKFQYSKLPEVTKTVTKKETVSVSATATVGGFDPQGGVIGQHTFLDGVITFNALGRKFTINTATRAAVTIVEDTVIGSEGVAVVSTREIPSVEDDDLLIIGSFSGGSGSGHDAYGIHVLVTRGFIALSYSGESIGASEHLIRYSYGDSAYSQWENQVTEVMLKLPSIDSYQVGKSLTTVTLPHTVTETVEKEISATAEVSVRGLMDESDKIQQIIDAIP